MNNDSNLLAEKYVIIQEGKPFGAFDKLKSVMKTHTPFSASTRQQGQSERNFQTNVNAEFDRFKAWLYSRHITKPTVGNFITYFNQNVGLPTAQSKTLQAFGPQQDQIIPGNELSAKFLSAIKDYEELLTTPPVQVNPQPAAEQPAPVDMAELKKMFDRKVKQVVAEFKKKNPSTPNIVVNTFVNTLANASAQALNATKEAMPAAGAPGSVAPETKPVRRRPAKKT